MASTLDLDRLVALAAEKAAKVVLVGNPAQIGVINGPGGMLAALVHTGHGSTPGQIHRFTHAWERTATQLALRWPKSLLTCGNVGAPGRIRTCASTSGG